jgi:predicted phage tail protein
MFTVRAVDAMGNKGEVETAKATPADVTPPAKITGLTGTLGNGIVRLNWTDPADADLASIEITFTPTVMGVTQPISVT